MPDYLKNFWSYLGILEKILLLAILIFFLFYVIPLIFKYKNISIDKFYIFYPFCLMMILFFVLLPYDYKGI